MLGAAAKHQLAGTFHHIKAKGQHQRLQSRAGRVHMSDTIAAQVAIKFGGFHIRKPRAGANLAHHRIKRAGRRATSDPMALVVVVTIRPQFAIARKGWIGARVPSPDMCAGHIQHWPVIFDGLRVVLRIVPIAINHAQILHLDQLITPPVGIARQGAFRAFGIDKFIGLIGALIKGISGSRVAMIVLTISPPWLTSATKRSA